MSKVCVCLSRDVRRILGHVEMVNNYRANQAALARRSQGVLESNLLTGKASAAGTAASTTPATNAGPKATKDVLASYFAKVCVLLVLRFTHDVLRHKGGQHILGASRPRMASQTRDIGRIVFVA